MIRTMTLITALGLACQLALAAPPGGARNGRPPIDEIAAKLGLDDYQKTEMQRIFDAAHAGGWCVTWRSKASQELQRQAVVSPRAPMRGTHRLDARAGIVGRVGGMRESARFRNQETAHVEGERMSLRAPVYLSLFALLLGMASFGVRAQDPAPDQGQVQAPAATADLKYSNKWRIKVKEGANNDGVLRFRVTPKGEAPVEITVPVKNGRSENGVAQDVRNAFKAALDAKRFHVEIDDGEDVLVKKKGKGVDTAIELLEDNIKGTHIKIERE